MKSSLLESNQTLSPQLRAAVTATAVINFVIGLAFLFGPELKITLWPTAVPPLLMRFIGSIVLANGIGAWMIASRGIWQESKVLFAVALAYGAIILPFLIYHLLIKDAPAIFWIYVAADVVFLFPIIAIYRHYEQKL